MSLLLASVTVDISEGDGMFIVVLSKGVLITAISSHPQLFL